MDQTDFPHEAWQRLGAAVRRRRIELGYSQPQLNTAGGPSTSMISKVESARGYPYGDRVIIRLEDALGWKRGSVEAVLDGEEPTLAQTASDLGAADERPAYPEIIGDDPFFRHIWDATWASPVERQIAIRAVRSHREIAAEATISEQDERRRA